MSGGSLLGGGRSGPAAGWKIVPPAKVLVGARRGGGSIRILVGGRRNSFLLLLRRCSNVGGRVIHGAAMCWRCCSQYYNFTRRISIRNRIRGRAVDPTDLVLPPWGQEVSWVNSPQDVVENSCKMISQMMIRPSDRGRTVLHRPPEKRKNVPLYRLVA